MAMSAAVITVPAFASARDGVRHFFGTRRHADSLALEAGVPARHSLAKGHGWLLSVKQVHGTDALVVDRPLTESDQFPGGWDALVTDQPGVTVAVRTADCVPVLVHDPGRRVVAAIHAGWRGAVAGIVPKTMELMASRFGSMRLDLRVSIGPSAGPCCYEVDDPVLEHLRSGLPDWQSVLRDYRGHKARLDLKALIRRQVEELGVSALSVSAVNLCTICNHQLFYSYRREGRVTGTMVSGITLLSTRYGRSGSAR
jgi:YfiH family protein